MDIEQQAETQPAHAEGHDLRIVRGQEIRGSFDFNDHLSVHEDVRAETFVELGAGTCLRAALWFFVHSVLNA